MKTTKSKNNGGGVLAILALSFTLIVSPADFARAAPMGTAFTYQGRLLQSGSPLNGSYDFQFKLYNASSGGSQLGSTVTADNVNVADGYFTVKLDFGGAFDGNARWLEIGVRTGTSTGSYSTLSPRQELTPSPYAIYAANGGGGGIISLPSGNNGDTLRCTGSTNWIANNLIYNNGTNIGIGTSSPAQKLHVAGGAAINGNLGIGTTAPGAKLEVAGQIKVTGGSPGSGKVLTSDATGLATWQTVSTGLPTGSIGSTLRRTETAWAADTFFYNSGLRIGIGTTSPTEKLDVSGNIKVSGTGNGIVFADGTKQTTAASGGGGGSLTLPYVGSVSEREIAFSITNTYSEFQRTSPTAGYFSAMGPLGLGIRAEGRECGGTFNGELGTGVFGIGRTCGGGFRATSDTGYGVEGLAVATGDVENYGGFFEAAGDRGRAVYGYAGAKGDYENYGGFFEATGWRGCAVYGKATSNYSGVSNTGGFFESAGGAGYGVYGKATHTGNNVLNTGGFFESAGGAGYGVYGKATNTGDVINYGGYFTAEGAYGVGIYAQSGPSGLAAFLVGKVRIKSRSSGEIVMDLGEGLDYAEGFDVSEKSVISPGSVLVIDANNPGQLKLSDTSYDKKVAGIVAGAKGLGSGVRLGSDESDANVALAGRVYCNVDATESAIEPGDLLTTSSMPGYAMKAVEYMRAQGAILGKAMERLEKGKKAQILVLVTLQ